MVLRITEYASGGYAGLSGRGGPVIPTEPATRTLQMAITAASTNASTAALSGTTYLVRMDTDLSCCILFGSSNSVTIATTTTGGRIVANTTPEYRFVKPYMRVTALST